MGQRMQVDLGELDVNGESYAYYPVSKLEGAERLPYSLTVLLENVLRNARNEDEARLYAQRIVDAGLAGRSGEEVEFAPARVLFQDFTGVPVFVDFAAMREACEQLGGDSGKINPQVPCDLVIDHSVIADEFGCEGALKANMALEFERNRERYAFLKWAQDSFENVRIVPPGSGICHQLNIEVFSSVVQAKNPGEKDALAYFDTVVGTDSHTPTANGISVLGWGVGGIEAEAAALGQPITILVPPVVGVHLVGELGDDVEAMDVALNFAQVLREKGVVGCFVECFGEGVSALSATQRACIANMTPEYGATCTLFPTDERTLDFLAMSGRSPEQVALVEAYAKTQGLWHDDQAEPRVYSDVIEFDLGAVAPSIAGPSRPHDRFDRASAKQRFRQICEQRGCKMLEAGESAYEGDEAWDVRDGTIAIAAVTSCTTATDPHMMLACGLLAKKAAEFGLKAKPWVKTVFAPGSHATELLLEQAGLKDGLQALGFATCGFGCMSCIGNSGPILAGLKPYAGKVELASVLSGNRNFEGRISPDVSQNYLMTPAAVVAYALAGTMDIDFAETPLGLAADGAPVYLADIWPSCAEIDELVERYVNAELYAQGACGMYEGDDAWRSLAAQASSTFDWDEKSTYVRKAPYFEGMALDCKQAPPVKDARVLALLGDFITTDHISPAGSFAEDVPAGRYLCERGVAPELFNTYGSRRGNHEVMMRGTFANVKLQNALAEGRRGGWTRDFETGDVAPLFDVAMKLRDEQTPSVVIAGKMYGSGSSRDWAAKGPLLLGVRAVIAESFERIHRSNLIGMGILPLQFEEGASAASLGIDGSELISIGEIDFSQGVPNPASVEVVARREDGNEIRFTAKVRVDTPTEGEYYANGGILQYVLRNLIKQ